MADFDEISTIYEKQEDIDKIRLKIKNFSFDSLIKPAHFYYSLDQKGTDIKILKENFGKFDNIKLVCKRKHRNGNVSYDFYYELEDSTYLIYAIALEEKPVLLNGFKVNRNFKSFRRNILKAYRDKLSGL